MVTEVSIRGVTKTNHCNTSDQSTGDDESTNETKRLNHPKTETGIRQIVLDVTKLAGYCKEYMICIHAYRIPIVYEEPIAELEADGYTPYISCHLP